MSSSGRVVVVGDALLDCDVSGAVERVCPDAPVPVFDEVEQRLRPGGAALAAALLGRDGRATTLITALGADEAGGRVRDLVERAGVEVLDLGLEGPTPEKVRIRAGDHSLLRLDRGGSPSALRPGGRREVDVALHAAAAVLVADYGRGVAADGAMRPALASAATRAPLVWDPHPRGPAPVAGARMATPNRAEAARFVANDGLDGIALDTARALALRRQWQSASIALTLGHRGALFVDSDGAPLVVPASPCTGDSCGAGDRFASSAAAALADGALPSEAVTAAVAAASAFVAAGGAATFTVDDTQPHARHDRLDSDSVVDAVRMIRARGGTVVATGGCFDILHAGHVQLLEAARRLGDYLVVLLNDDASVRRLKGPERPYVNERDRAALLRGLRCVDAVETFGDDTPVAALERLRPDVFVKGADYRVSDIPEAAVLARWGGQAVAVPYLQGRSTTRIAQEVARRGPH